MDVTIYTRRDGKVEDFRLEGLWYFATVKEIKEAIGSASRERGKEVPVASMRLFLGGTELRDDKNTEDYSIVQGSRIRLVYYDE